MKNVRCSRTGVVAAVAVGLLLGRQAAKGDFLFGEPSPVANLNSASADAGPYITADGLELYFTSNRDHGADLCHDDIWVATRPRMGEPWGPPRNLGAPVNTTSCAECNPCISADGLELYFSDVWPSLARACDSSRPGGYGRGDIWVSKRETRDADWDTPVNLGPQINSFEYDGTPHLSADGLSLYYCSARSAGHGFDLYVSTRPTKDDPWSLGVELGAPINTMGNQDYLAYPFLSPDGLSLFFQAAPLAYTANGDIFVSRRPTVTSPWGLPSRFTALNSGRHDEGLTFAPGDSILYFVRSDPYNPNVTLDPALATFDLWQVEVTPLVDFDGDGTVTLTDLRMLIDNWGTHQTLYDIGPMPLGDGKVDIEDLKVFIACWEKENEADSQDSP